MDNTPLISIVVPVYNVELFLDRCLQSITNQTYTNLEIILVDDGSQDSSGDICDAWEEKDTRIKVIHKINEGMSTARNLGVSVATGKWVLFVDSDDVISVYLAETLYSAIQKEGDFPIAAFNRFSEEPPADQEPPFFPQASGKNMVACRSGLFCFAALYDRELLNSIQLRFDPTLKNKEDAIWNGIYLRFIDQIQFINIPMYYYRITPNSATSKCADPIYEISCWVRARYSLLSSFSNLKLSKAQKKEANSAYRHFQNNIYAECFVSKIPCRKLLEIDRTIRKAYPKNSKPLSFAELFVTRFMPHIYYYTYKLAFALKKMAGR